MAPVTRREVLAILDDAVQAGHVEHATAIAAQIAADYRPVELGNENPWARGTWHGHWVSIDGCDATGFEPGADNELLVVAYGDSGSGWDGNAAGIVLLKDGRYCAWESKWGPTGSGFYDDAYGGDADVGFATSLRAAERYISERAREYLRWE